jgi:hypothetical protein
MHFLIGLGILAGLVWFTFGAGAARAVVGAALVLVASFFIFVSRVTYMRMQERDRAGRRDAVMETSFSRCVDGLTAPLAEVACVQAAVNAANAAGFSVDINDRDAMHHVAELAEQHVHQVAAAKALEAARQRQATIDAVEEKEIEEERKHADLFKRCAYGQVTLAEELECQKM